jgi:hypothetical protein
MPESKDDMPETKDVTVWFDDKMQLHMSTKENNEHFIKLMKALGFGGGSNYVIAGLAKKIPPGPPPPVMSDCEPFTMIREGRFGDLTDWTESLLDRDDGL